MTKWSPHVAAITTVGSLTVALGTWASIAAGRFCWQVLLASLLLWCLAGWLGVCVSSYLTEAKHNIDPIIATVLGFCCVSVILFLGTVILRLDVLVSLTSCMVLLGLLAYATHSRRPHCRLKLEPLSAFALLVAILFATLWSRQNLAGLVLTPTTVTSTPWFDTFYHSIHVAHFAFGAGDVLGADPLLATAPLPPYHYAAYVVPSLLVRVSGISAYIGTVALFAPLGALFTGLAAYSFGRFIIGPLGGLFAVVVCLAVPDPTFYLLENRWVSYFFFQQVAGNGAFGTAFFLMAWAFCIKGVIEQLRRYTFVGLLTGLCVIFFKSQVFLAYSFGLLLFASSTFPRVATRFRVTLGTLASAMFAGCVLMVLPAIPRAPTFLPGTTAGPSNLHWTLSKVGGSCQNCIVELSKNYSLFLPVGVPVFLAFTFGILVPLCLLLASSRAIRRSLQPGGMWFLWTALTNYLVVTLGLELNAGHGDPYEIIHKTFVWPYLAVSTWCGCAIAAWILGRKFLARRALLTMVLPLALVALGSKVIDSADRLQTGFVYPGSDSATRVAMPRDAFDSAEFVRRKTPRNAVVQVGVVDGNLMFPSLAGRRSYVAYPPHNKDTPSQTAVAQASVAAMLAAPTAVEFRNLARACHIDYFVLYPGQQPAWEMSLQPSFQSGKYRVFRVTS